MVCHKKNNVSMSQTFEKSESESVDDLDGLFDPDWGRLVGRVRT